MKFREPTLEDDHDRRRSAAGLGQTRRVENTSALISED